MMLPDVGHFAFSFMGISLSANGAVALGLALPVALLLFAIAYRIVRPPLH
jgi:hypothetical protein